MQPVSTQAIRDFGGKILGYIEEDKDGNQRCITFAGKVLGYYDKKTNTTREFNGKITSRGNTCVGFLYK